MAEHHSRRVVAGILAEEAMCGGHVERIRKTLRGEMPRTKSGSLCQRLLTAYAHITFQPIGNALQMRKMVGRSPYELRPRIEQEMYFGRSR